MIGALLVLAPAASAEPQHKGEATAAKPFEWDGTAVPGLDVSGEADLPCGTMPTGHCDQALIKVPGTGKLSVAIDNLSSIADYDLAVYESDASGKKGKFIVESISSVGADEKATVNETTTEYYLAEVTYYLATPADAYKGKATFEPGSLATSKITGLKSSVKAKSLKSFKGTSDGAAKIEIALVKAGKKCGSLQANGSFKSGDCEPKTWLAAKGTAKWSFKLRKKLAKGSYVVYSRATDEGGATETQFSPEFGNRVEFKVK